MFEPAQIPEVPRPPRSRLPLALLILKMISNPVGSWANEFYDESVVLYRTLGLNIAFVMNPELIQAVLLDNADCYAKNPVYQDVLGLAGGDGVLIAEGELWRWQRRLIAPLFRAEEIVTYLSGFVAASEQLLTRWRKGPVGSIQNIDRDMASMTLHALQDTVLGASLTDGERREIERAATAFLEPADWKLAYALLKLPRSLPHPGFLRMKHASIKLREAAASVLDSQRRSGLSGTDLLTRLATARDPSTGVKMPDSLIIDNIVTFFIAGHETTAQALTWTLYLLALFPKWQDRLRAEITADAVRDEISPQNLVRLDLAEAVLQEAMRLFPPAPIVIRIVRAPTKLGALKLKPGTTIVIPIYVVHRHRRLWQHPLAFDPSRFNDEAKANRHRCAYMPFGAGPRTCVGGSFAMLEGKVMLARLVSAARFELPRYELPIPLARITLRAKEGLRLKVTML
jgi:cytochrome P450